MALDKWADYYTQIQREGGEVVEDDDFDLERILAGAAAQAGDDEWEPEETWTPESG